MRSGKESTKKQKQNPKKIIMDYSAVPPAPRTSFRNFVTQFYQGFRPFKPTFLPQDYPDLTGKVAVVTGINTGIGYYVAKLLISKNCEVYGIVRTASKGEEAKEQIFKELSTETKGSLTIVGGCDLSDFSTVKEVGWKLKDEILLGKTINIIIHNAGLMSNYNNKSNGDGIEMMFATNVMGPQLLQHYLDPLFLQKDSDLKRIVWVSSCAHQQAPTTYGFNFEDPMFRVVSKRPNAQNLYGQSKACNILQANAWATKTNASEYGIISASVFPGILKTDLVRDFPGFLQKAWGKIFYEPIYGAYSELFAALSPKITTQGVYVVPFGEVREPRADIAEALKNGVDVKFWDFIEEQVKEYF